MNTRLRPPMYWIECDDGWFGCHLRYADDANMAYSMSDVCSTVDIVARMYAALSEDAKACRRITSGRYYYE